MGTWQWIFHTKLKVNMDKSNEEHIYTSTGQKFWRHLPQLVSYREGTGNTIISTHISPEGSCNLSCSYCSFKKRDKRFRISIETIKDYVNKLCTRGLKAVILTGGGEPTMYPNFNELIRWLKLEKGLSVALITNGTCAHLVDTDVWSMFSWIRVSFNELSKIKLPTDLIPDTTIVGCSYVDTGSFEEMLPALSSKLDELNATYLRVTPSCLLDKDQLSLEHDKLDLLFKNSKDTRFFHQRKTKGIPCKVCHQSYFKLYLSEIDGGTVFPCDSATLNEVAEHLDTKFAICKASDVLDFLDKKIYPKFNPLIDCRECICHDTIHMLDSWLVNGTIKYSPETIHDDFV